MIVKDSRSPRGRIEEQPREGDALRGLRPIGGGPMEEGQSWMNMSFLFSRRPRPAAQRTNRIPKPVELVCEELTCRGTFTAVWATLARFCSAKCRKRTAKRQQRARMAA